MNSLELLKKVCEVHGQRKVAKSMNRSVTAINQTLHGKYPNPEPILEMVELIYGAEFKCPVLGAIHPNTCDRYREWAKSGKVHTDRLYRLVKNHCATCTIGEKR